MKETSEVGESQSEDGTGRVGRPTKFSDAVLDKLCEALADGMPIRGACVIAGIGVTTLSEWRELHPEIEDAMSETPEHARQKALRSKTPAQTIGGRGLNGYA